MNFFYSVFSALAISSLEAKIFLASISCLLSCSNIFTGNTS